jgi:hypothetical protein
MGLRPILLLALPALFFGTGCKKEQTVQVPLVNVDISININLPAYNALAVPGGWVYLTGGSQGIIVYRNTADISSNTFTALDRHCTFQPENLCRVTVDGTGLIARDTTCCHSAFQMIDGSVVTGPAVFGLKRYNTTFNGTVLRIFN